MKSNYFRCNNGTISVCKYIPDMVAAYSENSTGYVLTIITLILGLFLILVALFSGAIYILRYSIFLIRRKNC